MLKKAHLLRWRRLALALACGLVAATAMAQPTATSERRFALPDHGAFVAQVPRDWNGEVQQPPNRLPPTITLGPVSGKPFRVFLTPIWPPTKDHAPATPRQMRAGVERGARSAEKKSVEPILPVIQFKGRAGGGFYFSATDRAPKPGEYKFLTQGILRVGDLAVTFMILTNDGQEAIVTQAFDLLTGAVHDGG